MNVPRTIATLLLFVLPIPISAAESVAITPEQEAFFEQKVRPLLVAKCFECHGEKKQESGFRIDSRAALLKGGASEEPGAVVGKPDESRIVAAVRYSDDLQMPPDEQLSADEIDTIVAWVAMGLPWPNSPDNVTAISDEEQRRLARETHWAFLPIKNPVLPDVQNASWPETPIDRFILSKLEQRGLSPSEPSDRRTLIRRASFDLLGLPPSPEDVAAFVADSSPDAYERLVDQLLSSPRYGERWGRHWLDVARYADTSGYAFNRDRRYPYSYTYRDYVIRSLNEDKPYDRFVMEQVAADLLDLGDDNEALAGLGFLTVGRKFNNRHDDLDDQIDVVCRGLMGVTVACARCHDHKYDPIPTEDYYSLYGVFASSTEPDELPLIGDPAEAAGYDEFKKKLDELTAEREKFLDEQHAELLDISRSRVVDYLVRAVGSPTEELLKKLVFLSLGRDDLKPPLVERWRNYLNSTIKPNDPVFGPLVELAKLTDAQFSEQAPRILEKWQAIPVGTEPGHLNPLVKEKLAAGTFSSKIDAARTYGELFSSLYERMKQSGDVAAARAGLPLAEQQLAAVLLDAGTPTDIPREEIQRYLNRAERNGLTERQKKIDALQVNSPGAPPRAMVVREQPNPNNPRVFIRGNQARPGKPVPRQFLYVVAGEEREPFQQGSGRLELARSIVADDNPLTRRVIANRVWMHHFGQPLVDTPSDFGVRCQRPEYAELLDYLASHLAEHDWSLKSLHREIMLSATYRQSSFDRPNARAIDPENRLLWRQNRRRLEFEITRDALLAAAGRLDLTMYGKPVEITTQPFATRRTVYAYIDRQDLPNLLRVFDFASPDQSSPQRPQTTVPQQALFLMNSPFTIEQAKSAAARPELAAAPDLPSRISTLYQLLFSREATVEELAIGEQFVRTLESSPDPESKLSAWEQYVQLLMLTNEFDFVD